MTEPNSDADLQSLRVEVAALKSALENQKQIFVSHKEMHAEMTAIRKEFADLNTDVKKDSTFYKWMASTGVFVAAILGAIGITQWRDIFRELGEKTDRQTAYENDLAIGLALVNGKRPQDATEHLRRCYDQTPSNETVAGSLLLAYQSSDKWNEGVLVANRLQKDRGIDRIDDPWIVNNIGLSLLYEGRDDKAKLSNAGVYLRRAASNVKGDEDERSVWINLWVYDLYTGNQSQVAEDLEKAFNSKSTELGKRVWEKGDWEGQMDWTLFKYLAERNKSMTQQAKFSLENLMKVHGLSDH